MTELRDLYVVTHTHWDREWYHTEERFRQRLVRLIDELLDDPPTAFLLDGQSILLDDYLAVRPDRAAELSTLLRDGRLEAGPWYVLADNLIPSGEALVRNLLLGRETVRRLRGEPPPVLYCPDSFGHPAILPDLAAGFGCDVIILWRGFGGARSPSSDVVRWRGPSGSKVLLYHLPPDGYEFGSSLPTSDDASLDRWQRIAAVLAPRATTGVALLLNGADHHARQRDHAAAIDALVSAASPTSVHTSSLRSAASALVDAVGNVALPEIAGELRDSYGYTWTLQGTLATRASQKRRNAIAERTLVRDVEPWVMLADAANGVSRALVANAWRTLLQAHPHDTLCGTSIDAVAHAFDARLASVEEQAIALRTEALHQMASHDAERARANVSVWRPAVLLRNPVARERGGIVELTLRTTLGDIAVGPGSASRQGVRRKPGAWRVAGMPLQILSRAERVELTESPRAYPDADLVLEARAVGWTESMRGYVAETRLQRGLARGEVPHPVVADATSLDNGRLRIEISSDGRVSVEDRELGRRLDDVISFERARDVGDLYTPAIRELLAPPHVQRVRLVHRGPLRGEIAIEYRVAGRSGGWCRIAIQLDANARAMRLVVTGENHERDHRLRLRVSTGFANATTIADAAFFPVTRTSLQISESDAAMEHVVPTAPLHRWIARFASDGGAVLVSDGLAESESLADGSVAVTLVRAVGELSRADLPERPGHAGWPAPTPGAQCVGPYGALLALQLLSPDSPDVRDEIEQLAEDELLPITGETLRSNLLEAHRAGGLELLGAGLTFSSAAPAQRDGWFVLRCVNQRDAATNGEWRLARPVTEAKRARLDETPLASLEVDRGTIKFTAAPKEIVTLLVR
ncbi:MAG: glycoside hydrolase family 38 [Gemmatimonadetes bacterium]|nr:glycoside hydrolase family 38 [Gemmatimonadota bacterium]